MKRAPMISSLVGAAILAASVAVSPLSTADTLECKLTRPDGTTQTIPCPPDESKSIERKKAKDPAIDRYDSFLAEAQNTLAQQLKDPESARWRDVYVVGKYGLYEGICGEIMAKNSYGAYTGWKRFIGVISPRPEIFIDSGDAASRQIIGTAYDGLNATWGGDGRTIFGTLNSGYARLMPLDGYCQRRMDRPNPGEDPWKQFADTRQKVGGSCRVTEDCEGSLYCSNGLCTNPDGFVPATRKLGESCYGPRDCEGNLVCDEERCKGSPSGFAPASRKLGESCTFTGDCEGPLSCLDGVCAKPH